jgi:hypothetical protein
VVRVVRPGELLGEDLDRDVTTELRVARALDFAHAALAEKRPDFVGAEASPGEGHGGM